MITVGLPVNAKSIKADCLVVGSGLAGMILSRSLRDYGKRIVVVESGREEPSYRWPLSASQFSFADYKWGLSYLDLHVQRILGGASRVWGGVVLSNAKGKF